MKTETNVTGTETGAMMLALAEAWEIIREVNNGDWLNQKQDWETAVLKWRDERYKPLLDEAKARLGAE